MTVEASLVIPITLAVIVILIYASFCMYDRCVGSQDAYLMCMREAQHKDRKNTRSAQRVENMQAAQFGSKYLCASFLGGEGSIDGNSVMYTGKAVVGPGVSIVHLLLPENCWKMQFSGKSEVRDPAWKVRTIRRSAAVIRQVSAVIVGEE